MTLPYYPFYWGDYSAKTFNLTQGQHGAYMLLLRYIYIEEDQIPDGSRYVIGGGYDDETRANIDFILAKYFLKKNGKWKNERASEIILKQHGLHQAHVSKGKKGGRPPKPELKLGLSPDKVGPKQPEPEPELKIERKKDTTYPSKEKRGTRIDENFEPDASCHALAEKLLLSPQEAQDGLSNFIDYWRAVPGAKGLKLDWQATFRNQLRHIAKTRKHHGTATFKTNSISEGFSIINASIAEAERREIEIGRDERPENVASFPRLRKIPA